MGKKLKAFVKITVILFNFIPVSYAFADYSGGGFLSQYLHTEVFHLFLLGLSLFIAASLLRTPSN
jgi:hypothetical protein